MDKEKKEKIADLTEQAIESIRTVYDPEIPVNVYDLGLIYHIVMEESADERDGQKLYDAHVDMTLTTANCPMADTIPLMVREALQKHIPDLNNIVVNLVWEPPWDPSRMSEEARFELDMF